MHLGIVGGGQLARMLGEAALRQGHVLHVTSSSSPTSAAIDGIDVLPHTSDEQALAALIASGATCITIENEFLDTVQLERCLASNPGIDFYPAPASIAVAQDKLRQKKLFAQLSIPTAAFEVVDAARVQPSLRSASKRFEGGMMLKWSRFGYDGKGNLPFAAGSNLSSDAIEAFVNDAHGRNAQVYAEQMVDFEHELAMVATRGKNGQFVSFPLVYSVQERSVCREVFGPAAHLGIDPALERQAREILQAISERLEFVGTLAVEFFLDRAGKLLANEMAPRVHNSGHYSLFESEQSQFDAHIQAITGQRIREPELNELVLMRNFLGPVGSARSVPCPPPKHAPPRKAEVYWYEKGGTSEGRKMGHMTGRAQSREELDALRAQFEEYEAHYWARYWAQHENSAM